MEDKAQNFTQLQVGKVYPFFATQQECYTIEFQQGLSMYVLLNNWTKTELEQMQTNIPAQFRWTELNGIGFLCSKFGTMEWGDCPMHPIVYEGQEHPCEPASLGPQEGYALSVISIDTSNGKLLNIRLIGLGHDLSEKIRSFIMKAKSDGLTYADYASRVQRIYNQYTPKQIASLAQTTYHLEV